MAQVQSHTRPRVVILGAGFGGLNAAKRLGGCDADVEIIDANNYHLFQPLLYQVASAVLSPGDIAHPIRATVRRQTNTRVIMARAVSIDRASRIVHLDAGDAPYDYLIVAAGMENNYFGHDQWREFAPGLKDVRDALTVRRRILGAFEEAERNADRGADEEAIRAILTFVIVGGGPTGVELAGAIREIAGYVVRDEFRLIHPELSRVIVLEGADRILRQFESGLSDKARRMLESLGAEVRCGERVEDITARGVRTSAGFIEARTVFWTAGVRPSPIVQTLGVELDRTGRVPVTERLTIEGDERVCVIGDLARFEHYGEKELPGMAPVAIQMGKHAAANVRRMIDGKPSRPFHFFDHGAMATIGKNRAIAQVRRLHLAGRFAWLTWLLVHIAFLIGFRSKLSVLGQWAYTYIAKRRSARLIVPD